MLAPVGLLRPDYSPVPARAGIRSVPKLKQTAMSPLTHPLPIRLDAELRLFRCKALRNSCLMSKVLTPRALRDIALLQMFVPHMLLAYQPVSRR